VVPIRSARGTAAQAPDFLVIDALATANDLAQGTQVLALLAELRGQPATRDAATLVLLPGCAVQTAALALDLGAGDMVAAPVGVEEIALRARALLARKAQADRQRDQLRSQLRAAVTDSLTGLHNRHHADSTLRRMAATARKDGDSLAVLMLDIDHFKSFNDRYGHATGNRVLIEVGRRLKAGLRPGDLLARIGGEEFLAALPGAKLAEARTIAERLRRAVADRPFVIDLGRILPEACATPQSFAGFSPTDPAADLQASPLRVRVTLSIGVTAASSDELASGLTPDDLLVRADQALYAAKASGRDAVATAPVWGQVFSLPRDAGY
jgi:two-component system cell cycle response regulator